MARVYFSIQTFGKLPGHHCSRQKLPLKSNPKNLTQPRELSFGPKTVAPRETPVLQHFDG
jgi:hypothetical protein